MTIDPALKSQLTIHLANCRNQNPSMYNFGADFEYEKTLGKIVQSTRVYESSQYPELSSNEYAVAFIERDTLTQVFAVYTQDHMQELTRQESRGLARKVTYKCITLAEKVINEVTSIGESNRENGVSILKGGC